MLEISIKAEEVAHFFGLAIPNSLLLGLTVSGLIIAASIALKYRMRLIPGRIQATAELGLETMLNFLTNLYGDRNLALKYFPYVATAFLFIFIHNIFGILPFFGAVGFFHSTEHGTAYFPLFRSAASDINTTLALSILSVFATHVFGVSALGLIQYGKKFLNFSGIIPFYVGILELIAEIAKIISFSFRLFGNIFAGEVLLMIIGSLAPYVVPVPFLGLEIFVAFIQALVFTMLTIVFIKLAITPHEHEEHEKTVVRDTRYLAHDQNH